MHTQIYPNDLIKNKKMHTNTKGAYEKKLNFNIIFIKSPFSATARQRTANNKEQSYKNQNKVLRK